MKNIVKSIVVPIFLSLIIGLLLGINFYKTYKKNLDNDLSSRKLYLLENGEYDTIETMREANLGNNYVYYKTDSKYKTVLAITNIKENIAKIKELYTDNLKITEYYIGNDILDSKQIEYDELLSKTNDPTKIKEMVDNILKLYQNDNNLRLIALS